MNKPLTKTERAFMETAMVDSMRLRTALIIACFEITKDPLQAMDLMEHFYDEAPNLIALLTSEGPAQVLPFPTKES